MSHRLASEAPSAVPQMETHQPVSPEREAALRTVLDGPYGADHYGNYESAVDLGLIDEFYYDPETKKDAIVYMLTGEIATGKNGSIRSSGFHHEPSGPYGRPEARQQVIQAGHYIRRDAGDKLMKSEHGLFEPYQAVVALSSLSQKAIERRNDAGESPVMPKNSSMFPKEYDALGVLRMVVNAKNSRDTSEDEYARGRILAHGYVPLLDGKTLMKIRMYLDEKTGKIINAHPLVKPENEMHLDEDDVYRYLYGSDATSHPALAGKKN